MVKLKAWSPHVKGIIGHVFHLSFLQRVKILFSSTLEVFFTEYK